MSGTHGGRKMRSSLWSNLVFLTIIFFLSVSHGQNPEDDPATNEQTSSPETQEPPKEEKQKGVFSEEIEKIAPSAEKRKKAVFSEINDGGNLDENLEESKTYRSKQFINLTLGLEQDVRLPTLPQDVIFKGDFRKITSASISKELGVLRLIPKSEGFGSLTIHDKKNGKVVAEYRIDVRKSNLDKVVREVRSLLGDIEGIQIKVVNNKVVIDGLILLPRDMSRIYSVAKQFNDQVSILVSMSPIAMKKIAEFIARDIANPEVEVRAINNKFLISGYVNSKADVESALNICELYMPDAIMDQAEAEGVVKKRKPMCAEQLIVKEAPASPPPKMIQLIVHYVELSKDYSKAFKFEWRPAISDETGMKFTVGSGNVVTSITGIISNLLPKLNWAKQHGHARVLESTSLMVEEGKKGDIAQTTKIPYSVLGQNGTQGTAYEDIGIKTGITAMIQDGKSGSVRMDLQFSVKTLLQGGEGGAPPKIADNSMNTQITVRDRQSAAVGGLIRNTASTSYNKAPNTRTDPLISLLASKSFQRDQSQFVVFVTPVIKTSASAGSEQIKKKFRLHE